MKRIFALLIATIMLVSVTQAGIIAAPVSTDPVATNVSTADALGNMDAKTFLTLTPAKVKEITGKKMTLKEKIGLKLAQRHVKRELKKGHEVNVAEALRAEGNFNWGAAALGFFLGLIGVLIVYLAFKNDKETARKSAWVGFGIWVAVWLLVFVI
jgi:phosphate-selective porin